MCTGAQCHPRECEMRKVMRCSINLWIARYATKLRLKSWNTLKRLKLFSPSLYGRQALFCHLQHTWREWAPHQKGERIEAAKPRGEWKLGGKFRRLQKRRRSAHICSGIEEGRKLRKKEGVKNHLSPPPFFSHFSRCKWKSEIRQASTLGKLLNPLSLFFSVSFHPFGIETFWRTVRAGTRKGWRERLHNDISLSLSLFAWI